MGYKKDLTPKHREELLSVLKARLKKIGTAIKVLNGLKYKRNWKGIGKPCGRWPRWKGPAVNRMW
jgi:hypothetical protein